MSKRCVSFDMTHLAHWKLHLKHIVMSCSLVPDVHYCREKAHIWPSYVGKKIKNLIAGNYLLMLGSKELIFEEKPCLCLLPEAKGLMLKVCTYFTGIVPYNAF